MTRPPRWAEAMLRGLLPPRDRDTVSGDLLEEYRDGAVPTLGIFRARLWYLRQVLSLMTIAGFSRLVVRTAGRKTMVKQSVVWTSAAAIAVTGIFVLVARNNFGPPRLPPELVVLVAAALAVGAATAVRSTADAGFLWRAGRLWGGLFAAVIVVRMVVDVVAPFDPEESFLRVHDGLRGPALGVAVAAIFLAAGFRGAWRTGRVRTGTLAAMAASVIGSVITVAVVNLVFGLLFEGMPGTPAQVFAIQNGGAVRIPLILLMIGTVLGTIGAMFGRGLAGMLRRPVAAQPG